MTVYGLSATGFYTPSIQELRSDFEADLRTSIDPAIDLSADQPLEQWVGLQSARNASLWNVLGELWHMMDPEAAEGIQLDNVSSITGTKRPDETFTIVDANVTLNSSTLSAGALASVDGHPEIVFTLVNDVSTSTTATSTASVWQCLTAGAIQVQPGTLTVITTPVAGWTAITNPSAGSAGLDPTTDTQLRKLRSDELAATGSCNPDALDGKLEKLTGMLSAVVYENRTDSSVTVTGASGAFTRTPHTFEAVIWDGPSPSVTNSTIAQTIWDNKPSGISAVGSTTTTTIVDMLGNTQVVPFTRATGSRLYVIVSVVQDPTEDYAGDTALKAALVEYITTTQNKPGKEVITLGLKAAALAVQGVLDIPSLTLGYSPAPVGSDNITNLYDQLATLDAADVSFLT